MNTYTDSERLLQLANWFDQYDASLGREPGQNNEVQKDLRRISEKITNGDYSEIKLAFDLDKLVKEHEQVQHHYSSGDLEERLKFVISWYKREAADQIAERKNIIETSISYFRSFRMLCESVGMGSTHAEKEHRLRGLIQLLDVTIEKLREEETENLENNWPFFKWGNRSDYPYRDILRKFDELKRENEELKKRLPKEDAAA